MREELRAAVAAGALGADVVETLTAGLGELRRRLVEQLRG